MTRPTHSRRRPTGLACEDGLVSTEAVIILPILILIYMAGFVFFDAYRARTVLTKSGYVVGDLLSRQVESVEPHDIAGLSDMLAYLTFTPTSEVRVTQVLRRVDADAGIDSTVVVWSHPSGSRPPIDAGGLSAMMPRLPSLAPNESVTVVETFVPYRPPLDVGIPAYTMETLVVTRPRAGELCFEPSPGDIRCG